jgi:hypothetical protein
MRYSAPDFSTFLNEINALRYFQDGANVARDFTYRAGHPRNKFHTRAPIWRVLAAKE